MGSRGLCSRGMWFLRFSSFWRFLGSWPASLCPLYCCICFPAPLPASLLGELLWLYLATLITQDDPPISKCLVTFIDHVPQVRELLDSDLRTRTCFSSFHSTVVDNPVLSRCKESFRLCLLPFSVFSPCFAYSDGGRESRAAFLFKVILPVFVLDVIVCALGKVCSLLWAGGY